MQILTNRLDGRFSTTITTRVGQQERYPMPVYDRHCNKCDEVFEVVCKISEKDATHECPMCGSIDGTWLLSAPAVSMNGARFSNSDNKSGFGDVIQKIASKHKNTPICERL